MVSRVRCELRSCYVSLAIAKKYTSDHEAVIFDDETNVGTVTITDYAQTSLGDVVFVELPQEGSEVEQGGTSPLDIIHEFTRG